MTQPMKYKNRKAEQLFLNNFVIRRASLLIRNYFVTQTCTNTHDRHHNTLYL